MGDLVMDSSLLTCSLRTSGQSKVVDQADGEDDHDEERHGSDHDDDRPYHAHASVDQHPDVHQDLEVDIVNVFGESVEDTKH